MNKKTLIVAASFGIPWALFMIVYTWIVEGDIGLTRVVVTLVSGVVAGILFAVIMTWAATRLLNKIVVSLEEGERVVLESGANHFKGAEGVGGKLVLTDRRLIFKSHKFNIQNHQDTFDLRSVVSAEVTKTARIFNNGLLIRLTDDQVHRFVVDNPSEWQASIMQPHTTH
jgi:hypothetical protein